MAGALEHSPLALVAWTTPRRALAALARSCGIILFLLFPGGVTAAAPPERLRVIIETDAGGDPDDEQSLVRFLLYANEWDVEAIIANRAAAREGENRNRERTGFRIVQQLVRAYGDCWPRLVEHDARYPSPGLLAARVVPGDDASERGVSRILEVVDRPDPRPVWYADWGSDRGSGVVNMRRALDRVLRERGEGGYARFKNRLRILGYDQFGDHTARPPDWRLWVNTFQPPLEGKRWYHRFSDLTARAGGFDLVRDCITGHGPLGALYPTNTTHGQKEGDSPTFLYLVPTGMNDPEQPHWGSWAGRYGRNEEFGGRPYYWANQADRWNGTVHRDNTLARWAVALQNDFRARLDWCVSPRNGANHPPMVDLNGVSGAGILHLRGNAGGRLKLDAAGTTDPDGDAFSYAWFVYPEAGTWQGDVRIEGTHTPSVTVHIPADAAGRSLHVVVEVTDHGDPPLTRYRRAVIEVNDPTRADADRVLDPFFTPPADYAGRFGDYRSPLRFANGREVRDARDWARRRAEIRRDWMEIMGDWPVLLKRPRLEVLDSARRDSFQQQRVRLQIAAEQTADGWLLVPEGQGPFPAVLVVYYEPETSVGMNPEQPWRDYALQLARRGFVTLSIGTPGGNAWKPEIGAALCQPLSFHAYVAANCWQALANLPSVDRTRIGIVGHSYGGKWALFAAALWDRFAAVAVSDPGIVFDETRPNVNYWEPWYLGLDSAQPRAKAGVPTPDNPRTGAYRRLIEAGRDLHELHALLAPRPFLVSGGSEDPAARWQALNHLVQVNALLGFSNRVAMTTRPGHSPNPQANEQVYAFFERFLSRRQP